jgi:hypothetical protein
LPSDYQVRKTGTVLVNMYFNHKLNQQAAILKLSRKEFCRKTGTVLVNMYFNHKLNQQAAILKLSRKEF